MYYIAVCEDDAIFRERFTGLLMKYWEEKGKEWGDQMQICVYEDGNDYRDSWSPEQEADILCLDIEMERMDGILLKEFLEERESRTRILFVTGHNEAMQRAFGENVVGFLSKPVQEEKLFFYLDKIFRRIRYEQEEVMVDHTGKNFCKIHQILWIQADGRYSRVKLGEKQIFFDKSLAEWEETLAGHSFCRIHKSYLVNFEQVLKVTDKVILMNGDMVPIARRKKKEVRESYKQFLIRTVI